MGRIWTCPENGDAGVGGGAGSGGTAALESCQRPYRHLHCSSQRSPGHQPQPRPISAPPHTSWAPPHLDSFLPGGGDLYPSPQLVRCVGSLKCTIQAQWWPQGIPSQLLQETSWVGSELRMWSPQIPGLGGGEGCILVCCFLAWNQASSVYILHPFAFGMPSPGGLRSPH